ncbi:HNH endonuclease [Acidipropionibacterium virtanenii]|uniref:HNH nuclease domain-containing protein n=1 Tax=Acidipropionibacterium virtanenii TaxID=2057246 RepID=A0A344UQS7_9ACTN|nr:HNH endonuclease signature motif containing protein [Acidipropionibacterium virtanenii]AXE37625.1 hypothetical protein JS278_00432 [Acidipropionibacterium virtanenii]
MQFVLGLLAIAVMLWLAVTFWYIAVAILAIWITVRVVRHVRMKRYFAGEVFQTHLKELSSVVTEHNEIAAYAAEIRAGGQFGLGTSGTGSQSDLAIFENTSRHGYRRDRNVAHYQAVNVHNCSLQVVRNASADPLKYLIKYFRVEATDEGLTQVEKLGETMSRLGNAVDNLKTREADITGEFNPPKFILKHYSKQFTERVGVQLSPITVPHPEYVFEYVSAGGNSSQRTTVKLDTRTIDRLIEELSGRIRRRRSAAGQRALMTARFREEIKRRDAYTCQYCAVSLDDEPHLLLEVDHIVPVSRGGMSTEENLQTLCWRCNRTKSNKMVGA